jgi:hypothetical protein
MIRGKKERTHLSPIPCQETGVRSGFYLCPDITILSPSYSRSSSGLPVMPKAAPEVWLP